MEHKIICIVGPTASGKTGMGVELATRFNGEIISADSRQVYRELDLGTGKEGSANQKSKIKDQNDTSKLKIIRGNARYINNIPQYLIDVCEPEERFTVFDWVEMARLVIEDMFKRGKLPVVVGGTGLYVQALVEGFRLNQKSKIKNQNDSAKCKIYSRQELDKKSLKEFKGICRELEIDDCKLDFNNPRRLIRAIERAQEGTCVSKQKPDFEVLQIGISLPREVLYEKIDKRVDSRFEEGMLEEVAILLDEGIDPQWLHNLGLEYRFISEYLTDNFKFKILNSKSILNDEILKSKEFREMAQELKWKTHAFARRQMTWFRRSEDVKWIADQKEAEKLVLKFIK